ncbi:protein kinase domain protein [Ichthyophthirius multifiliis]|uniref:Protein kinase domain protein n=1 Tax=Ichthyophthirius multifiliis TaxID=5932 RepID=G0R320_ICHMU|nr:protein kinase domain protein [Ichthyophthirius multifiliis]EGR28134.1 protein kinase domain protein [Ichthyophthirius multifiliis]|eukprot:XP_004027479.1 protein kinase domain protein [Ichthyophthirius multifiliis]
MGNEFSIEEEQSQFIKEFKQKYDFYTEQNDKRFGDIYIYKHKTEKKYITQRELFRRRDSQEFFSEPEIWYLLDSLIQACSYLEKHKIYHGDLRPVNIILTPEGFVKIADHGILHVDQTNYHKSLTKKEKSYLSPILMRSLAQRELRPLHDFAKSDVYSLGMTILEAASLSNPMCCYDYNSLMISHPIIEELLVKCRFRYSEFFVNFIKDMLLDDENLRPSF